MIRRIVLQNFMSHRHTVIEPADGLTVLVGENNCGKSAVVAALQILCQNANGDWMVRHGENECKVTVETDEGHIVEWKRLNGTVSYTLDGKAVHRLHGDIPEDLHLLLRMPQVRTQDGAEPFDIHFGEQKKPVFLLDEPGSRAAKFFASSSDAETLIKMQILHKNKVREATQNNNRLQNELERLDSRLEPLARVSDIQKRLDNLDNQYHSLTIDGRIVVALEQDSDCLSETVERVHELKDKALAFNRLQVPPRISDTDSLSNLISNLDSWLRQFSYNCNEKQVLDTLRAPPKLPDSERLEALTFNIMQVSTDLWHSRDVRGVLSSLDSPPKLLPVQDLEKTTSQMGISISELQYRLAKVGSFSELSSPPNLFDVKPLTDLIKQYEIVSEATLGNQERVNALQVCEPPPNLFDVKPLTDLIKQYEIVSEATLGNQERVNALQTCKMPPTLRDASGLVNLIDAFGRCEADVAFHLAAQTVLETLIYPPSLFDPTALGTFISEMETTRKEVGISQATCEHAAKLAADAEKALRAWAIDNRICPTCGAQIDPDRLVSMVITGSQGHSHE